VGRTTMVDYIGACPICHGNRAAYPQAPSGQQVEPTDEQLIALNAGERFFSESPTKYPEAGHGTQYHAGAPGVVGFARAAIALAGQQSERPAPASLNQQVRESVLLSGGTPAGQAVGEPVVTVQRGGLGGRWGKATFVVQWEEGAKTLPDGVHKLYARAASPAPAGQAHSLLDALIDIYDDHQNNPPEYRCYVDSAWSDALKEARQFLAASQAERPAVKEDK
jgi:hypothetical protein